MTRIAVTADLHCDDFGTKVDPATGLNARWVDTIAMARWIARDARERGAEALIVAGDLSESRHPAPWRVAQIGEALAEFGGPTILVRGNHDGLRADRSIVDVLAAGRPDWTGFSRPGFTMLGTTAIAALPYLDKHHLRALPEFSGVPEADVFRVLGEAFVAIAAGLYAEASAAGARDVILVVHQGLAGGSMSEAQQAFLGDHSLVVDTRALAAIGFRAVVAGHFHKHQVLSEQPLVAYAGAPYRTDFGEEHQEKGYLLLEFGERQDNLMGFIPTPARRFVTLDYLEQLAHPVDLDVEGAVVRVRNVGPDGDVAEIRRTLEAAGAFEVTSIERARSEATVAAGAMAEAIAPAAALVEYFAADPDREVLVARGRELLEEAA